MVENWIVEYVTDLVQFQFLEARSKKIFSNINLDIDLYPFLFFYYFFPNFQSKLYKKAALESKMIIHLITLDKYRWWKNKQFSTSFPLK